MRIRSIFIPLGLVAFSVVTPSAEPVRLAPVPLIELQATYVEAISLLMIQADMRGGNWIAPRPTLDVRVDVPKTLVSLEDLRAQMLSRLNMHDIRGGAIDLSVPACEEPLLIPLEVPNDERVTLLFARIRAADLLTLLVDAAGFKSTAYPQGLPELELTVQIRNQKVSDILGAFIASVGAAAKAEGHRLQVRKAPRRVGCAGVKWSKPHEVRSADPSGEQSGSNCESRKVICEYLEQFPMSGLIPRGYIVMTPASAVEALIEDPYSMLHRVRKGSRLGQDFSAVTGITRESMQITRFEFRPDGASVEDVQRVSLSTGKAEQDVSGLAAQKAEVEIPYASARTADFALEDLLVEEIEQKEGVWSASLRDVYGSRHTVKVGSLVGAQHGRIVEIDADSVEVFEIVPDNLGGYMESRSRLFKNVWFESPRAIVKRNYQAQKNPARVQDEFISAVSRDEIEHFEALLATGAMIDDESVEYEQNALYTAAYYGHSATIEWLLKRGARPNILVGKLESTPLHEAVWRNDIETARRLLDAGADVNLADGHESTPLCIAAQQSSVEMARLLLSSGADPKARSDSGLTPFTAAAGFGNLGIVKLLLQNGVGIDERDRNGNTMLAAAAQRNYPAIARFLLAAGANVNSTDDRGRTVLDLADEYEASEEVMRMLLAKGAKHADRKDSASGGH